MDISRGERDIASPEQQRSLGVLDLSSAVEAFNVFLEDDEFGYADEDFETRIFSLDDVMKGGFRSGLYRDSRALKGLDFGRGMNTTFWEENRAQIEALRGRTYAAYLHEVAEEANFINELIAAYPGLLRMGEAGLEITGVGAQYETSDEAELVIYGTDTELDWRADTVYIDTDKLPAAYREAVARYRDMFEV